MNETLIEKVMEEVMKKVDQPKAVQTLERKYSGLTEFVGVGRGDTIGLVIET